MRLQKGRCAHRQAHALQQRQHACGCRVGGTVDSERSPFLISPLAPCPPSPPHPPVWAAVSPKLLLLSAPLHPSPLSASSSLPAPSATHPCWPRCRRSGRAGPGRGRAAARGRTAPPRPPCTACAAPRWWLCRTGTAGRGQCTAAGQRGSDAHGLGGCVSAGDCGGVGRAGGRAAGTAAAPGGPAARQRQHLPPNRLQLAAPGCTW